MSYVSTSTSTVPMNDAAVNGKASTLIAIDGIPVSPICFEVHQTIANGKPVEATSARDYLYNLYKSQTLYQSGTNQDGKPGVFDAYASSVIDVVNPFAIPQIQKYHAALQSGLFDCTL